jgi:hypothetical protein
MTGRAGRHRYPFVTRTVFADACIERHLVRGVHLLLQPNGAGGLVYDATTLVRKAP